jgi:hypothetical protein
MIQLGHKTWNGIVFVCMSARYLCVCEMGYVNSFACACPALACLAAASWWYSRSSRSSRSMLALHRHQDGSLQIRKQDIVVQFARRLGLNVPRQEAYRLLVQVEVTRARARLIVFHEPLRLIDVPNTTTSARESTCPNSVRACLTFGTPLLPPQKRTARDVAKP